jgi:hypothetical protein
MGRQRMQHNVKCWPQYYKSCRSGEKPFEVRKHDRDYQVGDDLLLQEWDPDTEEYTGKETLFRITYVLKDYPAIAPDYVVMGIMRLG